MLFALWYKEWLKTKWTLVAIAAVNLLVAAGVYLDLANTMKTVEANVVLMNVVFKEYLYYVDVKYIPALSGLIYAVMQFTPELSQSRLKLTLHLPAPEQKILATTQLIGALELAAIFAIDYLILAWTTLAFFPVEVFASMTVTVAPWFFAGFAAYFITAAAFVEISWTRRVVIALAGYGFVDALFLGVSFNAGNDAFAHAWWAFALFVAATFLLLFVSGFHYKRGIV